MDARKLLSIVTAWLFTISAAIWLVSAVKTGSWMTAWFSCTSALFAWTTYFAENK